MRLHAGSLWHGREDLIAMILRSFGAAFVALLGALLAVPANAQEVLSGPSPATVAMRRQWLNPEINAFTFRDTDRVFESRPVSPHGDPSTLPEGPRMAMPTIQFGGEARSYE